MEPIKIFIENWPAQDFLAQYIPIVIAAVAVVVSLYSAYLSRKAFNHSSRPYVWASSYGVVDQERRRIIPVPQRLAYRVKNSPAKIKLSSVSVSLGAEEIFNHTEENFVRFPDDSSEWSFSIGEDEFNELLQKHRSSNTQLLRKVFVKYMSLDGGTTYEYHLKQGFISADNQWKDIESRAC
ncbi:MAG: hypothetical protein HY273_16845 [Gammaproteobacteria bacterium]|nr:hypothetical protein [Gammaproteobacteria bacterium]